MEQAGSVSEAANTGAQRPRVKFVHTLPRARDYQDRPEFKQLSEWWRNGGEGVCALIGIGGAGKTAPVTPLDQNPVG